MKKQFIKYLLTAFCIFLLTASGKAQGCEQLTSEKLREMLVQLGYEVTDIVTTPGKEKYSVNNKTTALNVPVGYELSPSKNFIWLTVNLGTPRGDSSVMYSSLLRENTRIQPCQFYITSKGLLMMGFALENRGLTNAILRKHSEKIIADVESTKGIWQK